MNRNPFHLAAQLLRIAVAVLSVAVVLWAFVWVATRPLRNAGGDAQQVELTVLHWSGGGGPQEDQIIIDLLATYQQRHPHVRIKRINPGDAASLYTKLQTMFAAGTPPDVFYMGSERIASFAGKDLLMPIEALIEADRAAGGETLELDDFYQPTVGCFRYDGRSTGRGELFGIPKDFTTVGFYYNKNLFDRAGVPYPPDDWTWDEFAETARKLGKLDGVVGSEFVTWSAIVRLFLWTHGLDIANEDFSEWHITDPDVIAALNRIHEWRFNETGTLTSGKSQVSTGEDVFVSGRVAMAGPFGRWVVPTYRRIKDFEWDFAPLPHASVKANVVFTVAWSIAKESAHPEQSWDLLKFLTGAEGQYRAAQLGLAIPTLKSVSRSDAFVQPEVPPSRDYVYLDQVEHARVVPWPSEPRYEQQLVNRMDEALMSGRVSVAQAAENVLSDWKRIRETPLAATDFPPMPWGRIIWLTLLPIGVLVLFGLFVWIRGRPGFAARVEERAGYLLVSPWVIGFIAFMAFPIGLSLMLAFSKWSGIATLDYAQWVGLGNFRELLGYDRQFATSMRVTAYYALFAVPGGQILALVAAILMAQPVKFSGFFRSAWYLPSVLAGVGVAILWRWVFDGEFGLMNEYIVDPIARLFGAEGPQWFVDDAAWYGPPAFAIMSYWAIGGTMVIYLAGLKGIPAELYEAASIDGATGWRRFLNVTLPMLSPIIFFNFIMAIIGSFQVFTQAYVMTGGGPGDTTRFYVVYLFNRAFEQHDMGYASAMAWILLVIILALTLLIMRGTRRFVYYEALR